MVIITCPVHPFLIDTLSEKGLAYQYLPHIQYGALLDIIPEATGIIISTSIPVNKKLIDHARCLQWIGRIGSGMEHVDLKYAAQKNIRCVSSPEGNCDAVAEHAIGLLISLSRNIVKSVNEVKTFNWVREHNRGMEIGGKTIGIIGYGNTGSSFAKKLSGFDVQILAHDKYKTEFGSSLVKEATLKEIMQQADIISFHLPLTEETKHYVNKEFFHQLEKKPIIINTSRGQVINTADLLWALENDVIKGATLDVLENENLKSWNEEEHALISKLLQHSSVIITPHIAGYSYEATYKMSKILLDKLSL